MFAGQLNGGLALKVAIFEDTGADNLNGVGDGGVTASHFGVHLADSAAERVCSVLFVHVDSTLSSQVAQNNSVVADATCLSLENLYK